MPYRSSNVPKRILGKVLERAPHVLERALSLEPTTQCA